MATGQTATCMLGRCDDGLNASRRALCYHEVWTRERRFHDARFHIRGDVGDAHAAAIRALGSVSEAWLAAELLPGGGVNLDLRGRNSASVVTPPPHCSR